MTSNQRRSIHGRTGAGALLTVLLAMLLAACGGPPAPAVDDPYLILGKALSQSYDPLRLQVGVKTAGNAGGDVTIEPDAIEVLVDGKGGVGSLRLAIPTDALGAGAGGLGQLGIAGDMLELEVLVDSEALYARSPMFTTLLPLLTAQTGVTFEGDLSGWLRLATADDLETLSGALGGAVGAVPTAVPVPSLSLSDAVAFKAQLEDAGVVVRYEGTESRDGSDAQHVTLTVDWERLAESDLAAQLPAEQLTQIRSLAGTADLSLEAWVDPGSGSLREIALEALEGGNGVQLRVLIGDPGTVSIAAPETFIDIALVEMLAPFVQMFGGGLVP